jgi:ribonucleoside-diphosphate reductase alpha chain
MESTDLSRANTVTSVAPSEASDQMSSFARGIYQSKYAWKDADGNPVEEWPDTAKRVVSNVLGAIGLQEGDSDFDRTLDLVVQRKFMPGGRYLYASGRPLHQTQNCLLMRAEDSGESLPIMLCRLLCRALESV